jgi:hypothetical protein
VTARSVLVAPALAAALVAAAPPAQAQISSGVEFQKVQIAGLAAWGGGGSVREVALDQNRSFEAAPVYGGALDIRIGADGWYTELYASRSESRLEGGITPPIDVTMDRYLIGIQQEKGSEQLRAHGTFYLGATRFAPGGGFDATTKFTGGAALGFKAFFTRNIGLRVEARGFYTLVQSEGGVACVNGQCLFAFSGSGLWQGDIGGGLVLAF